MKVQTELDRDQLYTLRDNMETWWRFIWEPTQDMSGWYAWRREPSMEKWVCLGTLQESRVLQVLNSQPEPLTIDDSIDFHVGLNRFYGRQKEQEDNADSVAQESTPNQEDT